MHLSYSQQMRFSDEQWSGLKKAASRFRMTGRQNAQREINRLFMAYFGLIEDPISAATMRAMIQERERSREGAGARQCS